MAQQAQEEVEEPKPDAVARAASSLRSGLPQFLLLGSAARPAPGQPRPYEPRIATLSEARAARPAHEARPTPRRGAERQRGGGGALTHSPHPGSGPSPRDLGGGTTLVCP